ncbi:hypothetical protein F5J12DRAFT_897428 [Pisolithus orientalis]|uniref:uncharacterized protein n=1 Tax=Pisolithus orientalis TaxID=936130 RepID=UPI00222518AC|nr:uncharacterized protein F5J12DRAFT_897428 [Pisolithus orientalis]KAI5991738.1 hypothetical protein F5J12DRAFT_897428 [Pisolithus orientalis]
MTRTRIESLLASFPKLIPTNSQHTSVETSEVRYVYQPLEDLYILLITNKASPDEREIHRVAFELLSAFDEIVSLGYREQVSLTQVRSILEMESHEEKIQEIIARNKEAEAKEELKRRARQLEMQRREQQKRAAALGGMGGGIGGGISGYSPVPRFEAASEASPIRTASPAPSASRQPAFKSSGMKLGSRKTRQAELLDALGGEVLSAEEISAPSTPGIAESPVPATASVVKNSLPIVTPESIHISIKETVTIALLREGGVKSLKLLGEMGLLDSARIFNSSSIPNVAKFTPGGEKVIALKDPSRAFQVGQALGVLKWRYTGDDESYVPLSINCWPSLSTEGTCDVNIEYELENEHLILYDVVISIPLPTGSYPTVSTHPPSSAWSLNPNNHTLEWSIPRISNDNDDATESTRSGTLEFSVGGDDLGVFFPVQVNFVAQGSVANVDVARVERVGEGAGGEVGFSCERVISTDSYQVV